MTLIQPNPYESSAVDEPPLSDNRKPGGAILGAIHGLAWSLPFAFILAMFVIQKNLAMQHFLESRSGHHNVSFQDPLIDGIAIGIQISAVWMVCAGIAHGIKDRRVWLYANPVFPCSSQSKPSS